MGSNNKILLNIVCGVSLDKDIMDNCYPRQEQDIENLKTGVPTEILLAKPVSDFIKNSRIIHALGRNDIFTIEDFIRFGKRCDGKCGNDFKLLLKTPQFGKKSYDELMNIFRENGIIDKDGNSELFEYIV